MPGAGCAAMPQPLSLHRDGSAQAGPFSRPDAGPVRGYHLPRFRRRLRP